MSGPLLSAPLLGGRVLELAPEARAWQVLLVWADYREFPDGED